MLSGCRPSSILWRSCLIVALLLATFMTPAYPSFAAPQLQEIDRDELVNRIFSELSPEQRVGQLFLVSFEGDTAVPGSDIVDLVQNYHIGGVVLMAENNNITGYGDPATVPVQVAELANDLQFWAMNGELIEQSEVIPPTLVPADTAVPLFIATNYEGDGHPYSEIWNGLSELPSNMAIGATWQPSHAEAVGSVVGQELSALGINMLLGPSLDVLENPTPVNDNDLGVRSFGGDPYWVGLMGQAYISGVHKGSNGRIALISKHFPGYGSSDRLLHEEIPTVRKSLEQLSQIELAPFFAVTGQATEPEAITDGLLTTHIRYQGFQGNIRATTNPVSFDPQALTALMQLESIAPWRADGGIIVSDKLGVNAVERFFDDTEQSFPHRVIAKDAFSAGNDLLYLGQFALGDADYETELANIKDTILWFRDRYNSDIAFQEQVDTAVRRILKLKLKLYNDQFTLENSLVASNPGDLIPALAQNQTATIETAQDAVTLIFPAQEELAERLERPPSAADNIVIFTDVRTAQQCSDCPQQDLIRVNDIADTMLQLYGPDASGQITREQISSFTFTDLQTFLDAGNSTIIYQTEPTLPTVAPGSTPTADTDPTPTISPTSTPPNEYLIQEALADVDWIIFGIVDQGGANSEAINNLLAQRPDLVRDKFLVAFAYNAPHFLDSTEISQLTAYYGLYSKMDAFIDASVRALFQELSINGAAPVNVDGIGYSLLHETEPSPNQVIGLFLVTEDIDPFAEESPGTVSVGDTVRLQTGKIIDHNGNPVPDGTIVRFIQRDLVQGLVNIIDEIPTQNGVAQLDYLLVARTEGGQFRIAVESGEATVSQEVDITVNSDESGGEAQITIINPTAVPTPTVTVTATATATETPPPTNTSAPTGTPIEPDLEEEEPGIRIELSEIGMLISLFAGLFLTMGTAVTLNRRRAAEPTEMIAWPLWGIIGSLICYIYYALGLPGTGLLANWGMWAGLATTLIGGVLGLAIYKIKNVMRDA